jgi:hypothetical protein
MLIRLLKNNFCVIPSLCSGQALNPSLFVTLRETKGLALLLRAGSEKDLSIGWKYEILRGVYPERDSSVASLLQNDARRAQNDSDRATKIFPAS